MFDILKGPKEDNENGVDDSANDNKMTCKDVLGVGNYEIRRNVTTTLTEVRRVHLLGEPGTQQNIIETSSGSAENFFGGDTSYDSDGDGAGFYTAPSSPSNTGTIDHLLCEFDTLNIKTKNLHNLESRQMRSNKEAEDMSMKLKQTIRQLDNIRNDLIQLDLMTSDIITTARKKDNVIPKARESQPSSSSVSKPFNNTSNRFTFPEDKSKLAKTQRNSSSHFAKKKTTESIIPFITQIIPAKRQSSSISDSEQMEIDQKKTITNKVKENQKRPLPSPELSKEKKNASLTQNKIPQPVNKQLHNSNSAHFQPDIIDLTISDNESLTDAAKANDKKSATSSVTKPSTGSTGKKPEKHHSSNSSIEKRPEKHHSPSSSTEKQPNKLPSSSSSTEKTQDKHHSSRSSTEKTQEKHHSSRSSTGKTQDKHHSSRSSTEKTQDKHHSSRSSTEKTQEKHHSSSSSTEKTQDKHHSSNNSTEITQEKHHSSSSSTEKRPDRHHSSSNSSSDILCPNIIDGIKCYDDLCEFSHQINPAYSDRLKERSRRKAEARRQRIAERDEKIRIKQERQRKESENRKKREEQKKQAKERQEKKRQEELRKKAQEQQAIQLKKRKIMMLCDAEGSGGRCLDPQCNFTHFHEYANIATDSTPDPLIWRILNRAFL